MAVSAQGGATSDSLAVPGIVLPRATFPGLQLKVPPELRPFGRSILRGDDPRVTAASAAMDLRQRLAAQERVLWLRGVAFAREGVAPAATLALIPQSVLDTLGKGQKPDSGIAALLGDLLGDDSAIGFQLTAAFESKVERAKNERCTAAQFFSIAAQCRAGIQPSFDLQFSALSRGSIADRLFVNVDYDTHREFRSSDNMNIFYQGKSDEWLQKLEFGNVAFAVPRSQFITSGIPQGNYGIQALGQLGPLSFRTIVATQQGNIPKTYDVVIGDKTIKPETRENEDYQIEARRFFFTVDPINFGSAYPNIDILNGAQMRSLAEGLSETVRPRRISVYRLQFDAQPRNPNGPRFRIIGDPNSQAGPIYQLLQENADYYTDPSLLWIALKTPLNLQNERLVIAYTLRIGGRDTVIADLGGTPDVSFDPSHPQLAHLLWDPLVRPTDPAFRREIRSAYRVAGEDMRRSSMSVRILAGSGVGQEKPIAGTADTYLQMFGLAQSGNSALFDVENRLWPRPSDPNVALVNSANAKIIDQYFMIMPSLRAFARDGLVQPGNPSSDTIYVTPGEDLYSAQHPPSNYRILMRFDVEGGGNGNQINVNGTQLRRGSETVVVDGVPLVRDVDYTMDYDLGMVTFTRPDTLFKQARRVSVRYEDNPLFADAPVRILGFAGQIPMERGEIGLTFISQSKTTSFTRPPLGYEPQSSLIAGVTGNWSFESAPLSRLIEKWPGVQNTTLSHVNLQTEFATSRPQPNSAGQAFVQTFENEEGFGLPLQEAAWYYGSRPANGSTLIQRFGDTFNYIRASTMAWQGAGLTKAGIPLQFTLSQIDPQVQLTGTGITAPESMLWLTLYPLNIGGLLKSETNKFQWLIDDPGLAPSGRRWRSISASLGPAGVDFSKIEYMTFWTLVDTAKLATNPTLIVDLGDVSENSVAIAPTALTLSQTTAGVEDSLFTGKVIVGLDELNTERDSLTRSFNQATDDRGLPGDVIPFLNVFRGNDFATLENFATCSRGAFQILLIGDSRNNCTVRNGRLDEEDLDHDNALNLLDAQRESERVRRYIVDLSNKNVYSRLGKCSVAAFDTTAGGTVTATDLCWAFIRIPFAAPDDSLNGGPNIRRIKSARLTLVSGAGAADTAFSQIPIAQFRFQAAPFVKRAEKSLRGIAGDISGQGFVIASTIGTQDRDTVRNVFYEPPPGVTDEAEKQQTGLETSQTQINEHSLRLLAGRLDVLERAESYLRFAEGAKNFMNYREMKLWARGRGNGWGAGGELQFYIKIARDANNFYLYRTELNAGSSRESWLPEIRIDFGKLFALRAQMASNLFNGTADPIACSGIDLALIEQSGIPAGQTSNRHAVCSDGYIAYSVDPAVSAPNLAQVQELSVGIIRVNQGGGTTPISFADTLEVWVDDVRLAQVEDTPGYAGQIGLQVQAGDVASFSFNASRRDANFRQLAELPTFLANDGVDFSGSFRLERLIPGAGAYAIPFNVSHSSGSSSPLFLSQSDILGSGIANLRTPQTSVTRYSISMRRVTPMKGVAGALLNNLSLNANLAHAASRSEFTDGNSSVWNAGLEYYLQTPRVRSFGLPRWMRRRADEDVRIRWNPTIFRFSSDLARNDDRRVAFNRPVILASDTGRRVDGLIYVLRTQSALEFRPTQSLSLNWDFTSNRDLRNYGDTSATAIIATGARDKLGGVDLGLERDRQMATTFSFNPTITTYFRPSVRFTSSYLMQRDPQTRQLVRTEDSTGAFQLPARLSNLQSLATTANLDFARALTDWFGHGKRLERVASIFQAIDFEYVRTLSSAYDGAPFLPGIGYQFAFGGIDDFRQTKERLATIAGAANNYTVSTGFKLRENLTVTSRAQWMKTDNFTRRIENIQSRIQVEQTAVPDVRVAWSDSLGWVKRATMFGAQPFRWLRILNSLTVNYNYRPTRVESFAPSETPDGKGDRRIGIAVPQGFKFSLNWRDKGNLLTNFSLDRQHRTDSLPGSFTETNVKELSADASRAFTLPKSFKRGNRLITRLGWQKQLNTSFISVQNSTKPSRLADNGTRRITLNADTDLAPQVHFSLTGAHVVNFDRNYDRKFSQLVLTAVFNLQYFAGNMR